jgi:hypothetical protein
MLNKFVISQEQHPTPEFNRFCEVSENHVNQVTKAIILSNDVVQPLQ